MNVTIDRLHWSPNTNTLSTEASDLGRDLPREIVVTGSKATHTFRNPQATRDDENDIILWAYTSTTTTVRVVVFND